MRAIPVVAGLTAGLLVLGACSSTEPTQSASSQQPVQARELQRDPHPSDGTLPEVDTSELWLPLSFEGLTVVDPGWDLPPQHADGIFLGATEHEDGSLEFTAVDVHGEVLWAADRPAGSTDFSIRTGADGRTLAVLPDTEPTEPADGGSTVSGYDLETGEPVWGPVAPPGPQAGSEVSEEEGTWVDSTTGNTIRHDGANLQALSPDGTELWSLSVDADTTVVGLGGAFVYLRVGDTVRAHNIMTGAVAQAYAPDGEGRIVVPVRFTTLGAALLLDGSRHLIATAPEAPPTS
ncbi:hypothetical protein [Ornithinimicrobium cavernae]|uniref:hypothetical protein n=1 Tax=Ornithinimicrobium cavernae TaxID=2666047 RepID=UPI000D69E151|nr:hypothetical protein [Ornithinimicrobium cavernae]